MSRSVSRLIPSPEQVNKRKMEIKNKVNKDEGLTFKPKVNHHKNRTMVDPNSNVYTRNQEFLVKKEEKVKDLKNKFYNPAHQSKQITIK